LKESAMNAPPDATLEAVDLAVAAARAAFPVFAASRERRAVLLEAIAAKLEGLGDSLLAAAHEESALPLARLAGERGRTTGQLRLFATVVRDGAYLGRRHDPADPGRQPLPRPELRRMLRPLGPVAVFGASNFPLAFSVAGGDTAAALAAGCPVIHKAHPAHPRTAALAGAAIAEAVAEAGLPAGVFTLLFGNGHEVGQWLAVHPDLKAIAFTGSLRGGRALFDLAAARQHPIPVYAEMGSTNPVFLLPGALAERGLQIAAGLAGSVTMGVGQFCTNPGLVFLPAGADGEALLGALAEKLEATEPGTMLYLALGESYRAGLARHAALPGVARRGTSGPGGTREVKPVLLSTDAATFAAHPSLQEEVFGPATLAVVCRDAAEMTRLAAGLEGQLTATVHAAANGADNEAAATLLEILADKAGRLIWNGFPTGVEVAAAMQHGGPYPATTDSRTTSVGTAAIDRFLRPVAYQDVPEDLLPADLRG
jgi:alpha-ketoglutaric semialdehyde dehydrogenase